MSLTFLGVLAAFACTLGIVPHLVAAATGLAALHASGVAFQVVRFAEVAYLLSLAWSTWRDQGMLSLGDSCRSSFPQALESGERSRRRSRCWSVGWRSQTAEFARSDASRIEMPEGARPLYSPGIRIKAN